MSVSFTERELDVMNVLWDTGPRTVSEVQARLSVRLAYTTVLTVLRTLEAKGHVTHTEEGRAHRYHPAVERSDARESAVDRLVDKVFGGSPEMLMTQLVSREALSEASLKRIRALLDERLEEEDR
jgi:BlaI family penicillinase repressor